jgi:chorismate dehydratase
MIVCQVFRASLFNDKLHSQLSLPPKLNHLKKIKVGAVSYLNTKPLLYGIKHHHIFQQIELIEDYPSHIAQLLIDDKIDLGLIPVASIPRLNEYHIITDYCIGANGAVASVCLFSQVPIEEVENVFLDYQSKTSVNLAKILLKDYWKKKAEFIDATGEDFRNQIKGSTAGVIIGDRALQQRQSSKYIYDLGEAWKTHTGLPFVFAAWISNKKLPQEFIDAFNEANAFGLQRLDEVILENESSYIDLKEYYTNCISYSLNDEKKKGLSLFLKLLSEF